MASGKSFFKATEDYANAYEALGVSRGTPVPKIRSAYIQLMKDVHPDQLAPGPARDEANALAATINSAWDTLKDAKLREEYDLWLDEEARTKARKKAEQGTRTEARTEAKGTTEDDNTSWTQAQRQAYASRKAREAENSEWWKAEQKAYREAVARRKAREEKRRRKAAAVLRIGFIYTGILGASWLAESWGADSASLVTANWGALIWLATRRSKRWFGRTLSWLAGAMTAVGYIMAFSIGHEWSDIGTASALMAWLVLAGMWRISMGISRATATRAAAGAAIAGISLTIGLLIGLSLGGGETTTAAGPSTSASDSR